MSAPCGAPGGRRSYSKGGRCTRPAAATGRKPRLVKCSKRAELFICSKPTARCHVGAGPIGGSVSWLVAGCVLRSAGDVAWLIGVSARSGEPAALHDQVFVADRPVLKPAFEDLAGACGVACLRRQRRAGDVRGHAMVWHGPPGVILRRGLGEPDIAGVAGELAAFERAAD